MGRVIQLHQQGYTHTAIHELMNKSVSLESIIDLCLQYDNSAIGQIAQ